MSEQCCANCRFGASRYEWENTPCRRHAPATEKVESWQDLRVWLAKPNARSLWLEKPLQPVRARGAKGRAKKLEETRPQERGGATIRRNVGNEREAAPDTRHP